ncbi:hypothetical protein B0H17DRAFT_1334984 [Mycena rosella]|uniref:Uncharacterized protein n=1 Tax=Mycena rosella TaxID=1033263 RepID=A0AAD7D152_MYCRO|nr:hypothetical protein B0H17DRAFT_1334984 [Mycena rosella]
MKVDLRGVGQNIQDHTYLGVSYELNPNDTHETYDLMHNPEFAAEAERLHSKVCISFAYFPFTSATSDAPALIKKAAESVDMLKRSGKLKPGQADILNKQIQTFKDDMLPDLEIIAFPGYFTTVTAPEAAKSYVTILIVLNHPLSHGTIYL